MPTVPPTTRDPAVDAHVFWFRFKNEIIAVLVLLILAILGLAAYHFIQSSEFHRGGGARRGEEGTEIIAGYRALSKHAGRRFRPPVARGGATQRAQLRRLNATLQNSSTNIPATS